VSFECPKCGNTVSTWDFNVTQQDGSIVYSCEDCCKHSEAPKDQLIDNPVPDNEETK